MLESLANPKHRPLTMVFFAVTVLSVAGAAVVGLSDNPPGIALAYLAAGAFLLALIHPWRTPRRFLVLFAGGVLGFLLFAILHNLLEYLAGKTTQVFLQGLLIAGHVTAFFIALLGCPPAILIGILGAVFFSVRNLFRPSPA